MKKTIIIAVAAIALLFIILKIIDPPEVKNVWEDNKVIASFPAGVISEPEGKTPSEVKIYIDASGSMKPYFRAEGNDMVNTISKIVNLHGDKQKIYFLGNDEKPYGGLVKDILGDVDKQPNDVATTFHKFFYDAAHRIDTTNVLIYMVTDGIMSIGNGNTSDALVQLMGKIENSLKGHKNLAGAIMRYKGQYKGDYWNSQNTRLTAKTCPILAKEIQRPFYVIALGHKDAIIWLKQQPIEKLNNPEKRLFMGIHDLAGHAKARLDKGDSTKIEDMHQAVTLVLDLPPCLANIDTSGIQVLNDGKPLSVSVKNEGGKLAANIEPSINLKLKHELDGRTVVTLVANNKIPSKWTQAWNTDDDLKGPDTTTTYGLRYLVEGMFNGLEGESPLLKTEFIYKLQ